MDDHLRAGIAIYNTGEYHAAHDAWEAHWLDLEQGHDDEQFLHGLIQFTAAVYHAHNRNWGGATGLADSALAYLDGLPDMYQGVDIGAVRTYLATLGADPACIERGRPLLLRYDGDPLTLADLRFEATTIAGEVLADEYGYDETIIEQAATFARADLDDERTASPFVTLLFDFVREPEHRGIVFQRLSEHVQKRESRVDDVSGLFDERED
jgi:hypothetical protein